MKTISRRASLTTLGGAFLAGFALTYKELQGASKQGCSLGFGTYGLPGFSLEEAIRLVADTGYDAVEIACMPGYHGAPDQIPAARRRPVRILISESGLHLGALMGLPTPSENPKQQNANFEGMRRMLELACDLAPGHPPMIQGVLGGGTWEQKKTLFRDEIGPWLELASAAGVVLAIKPHRGHALSRPEEAIWLIEELKAGGKLRMVYDYSHYAFRDMPVESTVSNSLAYTTYLVMKDVVEEKGRTEFKLPGKTGEMPHARILSLFYQGGYRGEVCGEVSSQVWKGNGYEPRQGLVTCYRNLNQIFADAGVERS